MAKLPDALTGEARGRGRPTSYDPAFARQAQKLCELGAVDVELAEFFQVALSTVKLWKVVHPEFSAALKAGKDVTDDRVVASLLSRALGYSHDAVKIITTKDDVHEIPFVEHCPPDVTACIFWLKNRRPKEWRAEQPPQANGDAPDLLAQIAADAPRCAADEPGPTDPIL